MSSITIDYIVYCRKFGWKCHFRGSQQRLRRNPVILFLERTWFLWWIVAIILILRWFHLFSCNAGATRDTPAANQGHNALASDLFPSGSVTFLLIQDGVQVLKARR